MCMFIKCFFPDLTIGAGTRGSRIIISIFDISTATYFHYFVEKAVFLARLL